MAELWASFPLDPRDRAHASLRASDLDRERITAVLGSAFADGRLDRDELDERMTAVAEARTLGELPPIVADLVPLKPPAPRTSKSLVGVPQEVLHARAVEEWHDRRRNAFFTFLASGFFFWGLYVVAGGGFPWPLFVNALALLNVAKTLTTRESIVREEVRRLEKKQARQERWPRGLPGPPS